MPTTNITWSDFVQNYPTTYAVEPEEMPVEYYYEEPKWEETPLSLSKLKEIVNKKIILRLATFENGVLLHNTDYNFDIDYTYFSLEGNGKLYPHEGVSKCMGLALTPVNRTPVVK